VLRGGRLGLLCVLSCAFGRLRVPALGTSLLPLFLACVCGSSGTEEHE
jgi:hypothetical protein